MRPVILVPMLCSILAACTVHNGHELTDAQVNQFVTGRSTIADVQTRLGAPSSSTSNSDGTRTLEYQWGTDTASGQNYIPIVGPFISRSNYSGATATYVFGPDGTLRSFKKETQNQPMSM